MPEGERGPPTPERIRPSGEFTALRGRLLLSKDHLNPGNISIPKVEKDRIPKIEDRDSSLLNAASRNERSNAWQGKEGDDFDRQKAQWAKDAVAVIKNSADNFKTKGWDTLIVNMLAGEGKQLTDITEENLLNFYDGINPDPTKSDAGHFVRRIVLGHTSRETGNIDEEGLRKNLPTIQWIAGMFGGTSSEIIAEAIQAEVELKSHPDELVQELNDHNRINTLGDKEKAHLEFLWGARGRVEEVPVQAPVEVPPEQQTKTQDELINPPLENVPQPEWTSPVNRENVVAGKAAEEIAKHGWEAYRKALADIPYHELMAAQLRQIHELRKQNTQPQLSPEDLLKANEAAVERMKTLPDEMQKVFTASNLPYEIVRDEGVGKIVTNGKGVTLADGPHTKIYLGVQNRNAPEAYKAIVEECVALGALQDSQLALYEHKLAGDEKDTAVFRDAIIGYLPQGNDEEKTKLIKAIQSAKTKHPEYFNLTNEEVRGLKYNQIKNLKIPIDDNTAFIELKKNTTWDEGLVYPMLRELSPNWDEIQDVYNVNKRINEVHETLKTFSTDSEGQFTSDPRILDRRKYMPALLFDEAEQSMENVNNANSLTDEEITKLANEAGSFVRNHPPEISKIGSAEVESPYIPMELRLKRKEIDPKIGAKFDAHGIAKGSYTDQLKSLNNLLSKGIDPTRPFHSTALRMSDADETAIAGAMGAAGPYDNGAFIVISGADQQLGQGIAGVLVNEHFYGAMSALEKVFPKVKFVKASDMTPALTDMITQKENAATQSKSVETTTPPPQEVGLLQRLREQINKPRNDEPLSEDEVREILEEFAE